MMGSKSFSKWDTVDGSAESWLEYSYYTFGLGENPGFTDLSYRCAGHGADDVALPGNLTYTGKYDHIKILKLTSCFSLN